MAALGNRHPHTLRVMTMINFLVVMLLIAMAVILAGLWFLGTCHDERNAALNEATEWQDTLKAVKRQRDQLAQALDQAKEELNARPPKKRKKKQPTPPPRAPQKGQLPIERYIELACYHFSQERDVYLPFQGIYQHYMTYCEQNSYEPLNRYRFSHELKALGLRCDRQYLDGQQCRVVWGIVPKL